MTYRLGDKTTERRISSFQHTFDIVVVVVVLLYRFIMDMNVFLLFLLSNTSLELFSGVFGQSQEIRFNLKDPESNEVISLGQESVGLVCHITNTANADIMIRNVAGESVATNMNAGNCLEHTISRLTEEDNGNYVCQIQYFDDVSMVTTSAERSLLLNVESGNQQCFRNGTSNQAFGVGDTLLLSCYCTSTIECRWISTVVSSSRGMPIPEYQKVEFDGNKRIIRVIVGPLLSNDTNTRYDCYYGSQSTERCEIGPTAASNNDSVLNAVDPSTILRQCPRSLPPTDAIVPADPQQETMMSTQAPSQILDTTALSSVTTIAPGKMTPGGGDSKLTPTASEQEAAITVHPGEESLLIYIIIAVFSLVLFFLVIFLFIFALCRRRKKRGRGRDELHDSMETSCKHNVAYDASDTARRDGDPNKHSDQPLPDEIGHDDSSPYSVSSVSGVGNDDDNGPMDVKVVQLASVNRHQMAKVSHNSLRSAVLVDQESKEEKGDEEFFSGEVIEYRIPVAFRAEEDAGISQGGGNFGAQE